MRPTKKCKVKLGKRIQWARGRGQVFFFFYSMVWKQAGLPKEVGLGARDPLERAGKCAGGQDATVRRRKGQWEGGGNRNVLRGRCCGELTSTCKNFGFTLRRWRLRAER